MSAPDSRTRVTWAIPDEWDRVAAAIIGAAMEVHNQLGPGLLERLYEDALVHEFDLRGIPWERQAPVLVDYRGRELSGMKLDLTAADLVVVELKSVEKVHDAHLAQLLRYMRAARLPMGLLINFHSPRLKDGIFRRVNDRVYPLRTTTPAPPL